MAAETNITRFLVIGCGHSGTSLVSGLLHVNGYRSFKVSVLFENTELNELNRQLIAGTVGSEERVEPFLQKLERRTSGKWCLKDPRLSQTAPIFYRHLEHPVKVIFVFRDAGSCVRSLVREREMHEAHLSPSEMQAAAETEYLSRTRGALSFIDDVNESPVLWVNYDDLVDDPAESLLPSFVGHRLDMSLVQPTQRRSTPIPVSDEVRQLHAEVTERYVASLGDAREHLTFIASPPKRRMSVRTFSFFKLNRATNRIRKLTTTR